MKKIRYRSPITSSDRTVPFFRHVSRLGKLVGIKGYRYSAKYPHNEMVMVVGEKGTARFGGVCWGYGGAGPTALRDLMLACGIEKERADKYAFTLHRYDEDGVDWIIDLTAGKTVLVKGRFGF